MYVRVVCEQVAVLAPALLADYRSPFTGAAGADNPAVFAGFVIRESETGMWRFHADAAPGRSGLPQRHDDYQGNPGSVGGCLLRRVKVADGAGVSVAGRITCH